MIGAGGQCRCGAVEYHISGAIKSVVNCHCSLCRSINGSAFSTYVVVSQDELTISKGQQALSRYQVTKGATKHYCSVCGTPLFNINPVRYPGLAMLYIGTCRDQLNAGTPVNIYSERRLPWVDSIAKAKHFNGPPQRQA